ncbi:Predicted DNA-binding transcriptional regulator YafY, contains an HTH and WYL domains [Actinacidiphila rubida]|uniref:Predicted DNA-binding transcriptional regulator YafY, contains an HTH and WYL domains n=1 Tax=Actinacidiphila rubida TaxID=310780 RepID=A0A1H8IHJ3_9ACTN|nr:WYL domain-containing protein [Actinacidiphila rubida]SEN67188.1 Predicted DNA-binding transcriptional regulator YafY, contains an HTH and WYL domains [Actinacidiphila rubida]
MKSSRLLSILLLLQTRGRMTAEDLAGELEVSVRTVYRDIEALHAAGVPLYGDAGHSGGYRVLDGYRTRLTGLTSGEAEALFLSGVPGPAAELGLGPALAAAQLKLTAALPAPLRAQAERIRSRFHLQAPGWYAEDDPVPFLEQVADAVWHGKVLRVRYRRWKEPTDVDRRLEPYGLVLKAGRWYAVAGPGPRTYRVDQILELAATGERFEPPADFVLAEHWERYEADFLARLHRGEAVVRLSPAAAGRLAGAAARALAATGRPGPDGWTRAVLPIESLEQAHGHFLAMGADVEVLEPPELRERLAATARALTAVYGGG